MNEKGTRSLGVPSAQRFSSKALIIANAFLETDLEKLKAAASTGYARGQLLPQDRKDWYD